MPEFVWTHLYENNSVVECIRLHAVAEIISLDGTAILEESR